MFPERNCSTCNQVQKRMWGCEGDAEQPVELDGELLTTCIRRPMLDDPEWFNEIYTMYKMYKNGFLPNEGTYQAQPVAVVQIINIIDAVLAECDEIKDEERERKEKNRKRAGYKK